MKKRKVRIGRPPMKNPRLKVLALKVNAAQDKTIRRQAAEAKTTVSTFILGKLLGGK